LGFELFEEVVAEPVGLSDLEIERVEAGDFGDGLKIRHEAFEVMESFRNSRTVGDGETFGEDGVGGLETAITQFVGRVGKSGEELEGFGVHGQMIHGCTVE